MNLVRTIGVGFAAICLVIAIAVLSSEQLFPGRLISHALALVTCLAGAAVFFISPYAIITDTGESDPETARTQYIMQFVMAGCYTAVLLMIVWLGYPMFAETNTGQIALTGSETAGLAVLVAAFGFSLACHLAATIGSGLRILSPRS